MPQQNQIAFQISDADLAEVQDAIATLRAKLLPRLVTLTAEERKACAKLGDKSVAFVQKVADYLTSNPEFAPSFLNVEDLRVDLAATATLGSLAKPLQQVMEALDDSQFLSGSEAYTGALMYYGSVKSAAAQSISGAKTIHADLAARFPGRSKPVETPKA